MGGDISEGGICSTCGAVFGEGGHREGADCFGELLAQLAALVLRVEKLEAAAVSPAAAGPWPLG